MSGFSIVRLKRFSSAFNNVDLLLDGPLDFSDTININRNLVYLLGRFFYFTKNGRVISLIEWLLKNQGGTTFVDILLELNNCYEENFIASTQGQIFFFIFAMHLLPGFVREQVFYLANDCYEYSLNYLIFFREDFERDLGILEKKDNYPKKFHFNINNAFLSIANLLKKPQRYPEMRHGVDYLLPATFLEKKALKEFRVKMYFFTTQVLIEDKKNIFELSRYADGTEFLSGLFRFAIEQWSRIRVVNSFLGYRDQISILMTHIRFRKLFYHNSDLNFQILLDNSLTNYIPQLMFMFGSLAEQPDKLDDLRLFIFSTSVFPACLEFIASTLELHWIINECLHIDVGLYNTGLSRLCEVLNHFYHDRGPRGFLECFRNRSSIIIRFLRMGCDANFILTIMDGDEYFDDNFDFERSVETCFLSCLNRLELDHRVHRQYGCQGIDWEYMKGLYLRFLEKYIVVARIIASEASKKGRHLDRGTKIRIVENCILQHFILVPAEIDFEIILGRIEETIGFDLNNYRLKVVYSIIFDALSMDLAAFRERVRFMKVNDLDQPLLELKALEIASFQLNFTREEELDIFGQEFEGDIFRIFNNSFIHVLHILVALGFSHDYVVKIAKVFREADINGVESAINVFESDVLTRDFGTFLRDVASKMHFDMHNSYANFFIFIAFMDFNTLKTLMMCPEFCHFLSQIINYSFKEDMANISVFLVNSFNILHMNRIIECLTENFVFIIVVEFLGSFYSDFLIELILEEKYFEFDIPRGKSEFYKIRCLLDLDEVRFHYVRMVLKDRNVSWKRFMRLDTFVLRTYIDLVELIFGMNQHNNLKAVFLTILVNLHLYPDDKFTYQELLNLTVKFMLSSGPNGEYSEILKIIKNNEELNFREIYFEYPIVERYLEEYQRATYVPGTNYPVVPYLGDRVYRNFFSLNVEIDQNFSRVPDVITNRRRLSLTQFPNREASPMSITYDPQNNENERERGCEKK